MPRRAAPLAVRGADLDIAHGERVALLGLSGAGKSSLLAALGGVLPPESGEREGVLEVDDRTGMVFQDPQAQLVMARAGDELLAPLRLDALGEANPHTLSGGEQWRLSVATALAAAPRLLILDGPTFGQDRSTLGRRARGVDAGRNPLAQLRLFASAAFTLLVGALRRGTGLATAMDARGFASGPPAPRPASSTSALPTRPLSPAPAPAASRRSPGQ